MLKRPRAFVGLLLVVTVAVVSVGFYLYSVRSDDMKDYTQMPDTLTPSIDANLPEGLETATFALG